MGIALAIAAVPMIAVLVLVVCGCIAGRAMEDAFNDANPVDSDRA